MQNLHQIHGYAIISDDDRIADNKGSLPLALHNKTDWDYFQSELDQADFVLLGRIFHEVSPKRKNRRRVVVSHSVSYLIEKQSVCWWNPETLALPEMLRQLLPDGGRVAVTGGTGVFDLCRVQGFTAFHLSRKSRLTLSGGLPVFSKTLKGASAEQCLTKDGLIAGKSQILDAKENVSLAVWRRV